MVLKAELHCHIEGAAAPGLVLARRGNTASTCRQSSKATISSGTTSPRFSPAYDMARLALPHAGGLCRSRRALSHVDRPPGHDLFGDIRLARSCADVGPGFARPMSRGSLKGYRVRKSRPASKGRMIVVGVRHFGAEAVEAAARFAAGRPHPLVTGFGMAGEERYGKAARFRQGLRDRARRRPRPHRPCRRTRRLGKRADALDALRSLRGSATGCARSRTRTWSEAACRGKDRARMLPRLEHRARHLRGFDKHPFPALRASRGSR